MKIVQIYPYNNPVSSENTKPVVLAGMSYVNYSKYKKETVVISSHTSTPLNDLVITLPAKNKKDYSEQVIKYLYSLKDMPKLVEVHQDTKLAAKIGKKFKNTTVFLIRHSSGFYKRFHEKFKTFRLSYEKLFLQHIRYVFGVSNFVTVDLQNKYPKYKDRFKTLYNTYGHLKKEDIDKEHNRENVIMFVGKPVKIKGIFEFIGSLPTILTKHKGWKSIIISGFFSKKLKYKKDINNLIEMPSVKNFINNKKILLKQNLSTKEVLIAMQQAEILVVPSVYKEVFGLVALEGHIAGCIVITSGSGGLCEISERFAYYLQKVTKKEIINKINYAINNKEEAKLLAEKGRQHVLNKFNPQTLTNYFDEIRSKFINE